ncbi:MAG TPA: TolC family protein [Acidobacteriaceae bacterium]|jgi:outer membrane protein|nr:TolC family protein [Acidobacteriaceae bacterium]
MRTVVSGVVFLLLFVFVSAGFAQSWSNYRKALPQSVRSGAAPAAQHLNDYVVDGKLTLTLHDAILLALENNSNVRLEESVVENQKMAVLGTFAPFDPQVQANLNINRYSSPGYTELQGVGQSSNATLNSLTQYGQLSYLQTFSMGTNVQATISSSRNSENSGFLFYNPYFSSALNLQFTQPLLRGAGRFANRAPILIARRGLAQSEAAFEGEVSDAIFQVVQQYWNAVQARGNVDVSDRSLKQAEASYEHDKKALDLGALGPLDIYRSESELAARRVAMIQAQFAEQQAEEALRFTIGADQDPLIHGLPLNLTEKPDKGADVAPPDPQTEIAKAISNRPEMQADAAALDADHDSIKLARNQLLPNLSLNGFYQSSGLGGNQYNLLTLQLISQGGFGSSFGQLFGFGYPGYGGTLTLQLPLRNHAAEAAMGNALVTRSHDQYTMRQTKEQIVNDVTLAIAQLAEARMALDAAETSYDLAQKSLAADQRKYELGAETIFFVLDSQARLATAEQTLLSTQIGMQVARANLDHATGDILEPYHVQISDTFSR